MEERDYDVCLCKYCIDAIKSRGEKIFVGSEIYVSEFDDPTYCDWCKEEDTVYECLW